MRRTGFTVVELMVALAIGSLAMLIAAGTVGGVVDSLSLLDDRVRTHVERTNSFRWLREMLASVEVDASEDLLFEGSPHSIRFHSWIWTPDGWKERSPVFLSLDEDRLVARVGVEEWILRHAVSALDCEYLAQYGERGVWRPEWNAAVTPPAAVRLRVRYLDPNTPPDILVLVMGERG